MAYAAVGRAFPLASIGSGSVSALVGTQIGNNFGRRSRGWRGAPLRPSSTWAASSLPIYGPRWSGRGSAIGDGYREVARSHGKQWMAGGVINISGGQCQILETDQAARRRHVIAPAQPCRQTVWLVTPHDAAPGPRRPYRGRRRANHRRGEFKWPTPRRRRRFACPLGSTTRMAVCGGATRPATYSACIAMVDGTTFSTAVAVAKAPQCGLLHDDPATPFRPPTEPGRGERLCQCSNRTFRFSGPNRDIPPVLNGTSASPIFHIERSRHQWKPMPRIWGRASGRDQLHGHSLDGRRNTTAFVPESEFPCPGWPEPEWRGLFSPASTAPSTATAIWVGGLGVSGDGVDQGRYGDIRRRAGLSPRFPNVTRADQVFFQPTSELPFIEFLRKRPLSRECSYEEYKFRHSRIDRSWRCWAVGRSGGSFCRGTPRRRLRVACPQRNAPAACRKSRTAWPATPVAAMGAHYAGYYVGGGGCLLGGTHFVSAVNPRFRRMKERSAWITPRATAGWA